MLNAEFGQWNTELIVAGARDQCLKPRENTAKLAVNSDNENYLWYYRTVG